MKSKKGFSLVELMIVVAVMAILTCIAYPMYTGYVSGSRRSEASSNLETLRLMEEEYFGLNGRYSPADGTYNGVAAIRGFLPDWQPGAPADMNYSYYVTVAGGGTTFIAGAIPQNDAPADAAIGGAPVANTAATIDQNNAKQGPNFW